MFVTCRFSTSKPDVNLSSKISDLQKVLNEKGYSICLNVYKDTKYKNKVVGWLEDVESDTLASVAIIFMQDMHVIEHNKDGRNSILSSAIMEISARSKRAFTICTEIEQPLDIGYVIVVCRDIVKYSSILDRVRITCDPEDLDSREEMGGVDIIYKK